MLKTSPLATIIEAIYKVTQAYIYAKKVAKKPKKFVTEAVRSKKTP